MRTIVTLMDIFYMSFPIVLARPRPAQAVPFTVRPWADIRLLTGMLVRLVPSKLLLGPKLKGAFVTAERLVVTVQVRSRKLLAHWSCEYSGEILTEVLT